MFVNGRHRRTGRHTIEELDRLNAEIDPDIHAMLEWRDAYTAYVTTKYGLDEEVAEVRAG